MFVCVKKISLPFRKSLLKCTHTYSHISALHNGTLILCGKYLIQFSASLPREVLSELCMVAGLLTYLFFYTFPF